MHKFLSTVVAVVLHVWRHPANRRHRVPALLRAFAFQARGRLGRRTLAKIGREGRMWAELHHTGSSSVVYGNPPDWNEMRAWASILRPGDRFIDVGSNVGTYALWAAEHGARVVAVEPSSDAFARLEENVALNPWEVETLNCALAEEIRTGSITSGLDTVNHLVVGDGSDDDEEVAVLTLDSLIGDDQVVGVKIDVEGAERLVLSGASAALRRGAVSVLQIEWNDCSEELLGESRDEAAKLLQSNGYTFFRPDADGVLQPSGYEKGRDLFALAPNCARGETTAMSTSRRG